MGHTRAPDRAAREIKKYIHLVLRRKDLLNISNSSQPESHLFSISGFHLFNLYRAIVFLQLSRVSRGLLCALLYSVVLQASLSTSIDLTNFTLSSSSFSLYHLPFRFPHRLAGCSVEQFARLSKVCLSHYLQQQNHRVSLYTTCSCILIWLLLAITVSSVVGSCFFFGVSFITLPPRK